MYVRKDYDEALRPSIRREREQNQITREGYSL